MAKRGEIDRVDTQIGVVRSRVQKQPRQRAVARSDVEDTRATGQRREYRPPVRGDRAAVVAGIAPDAGMQRTPGPVVGPRGSPRFAIACVHRRIVVARPRVEKRGRQKRRAPLPGPFEQPVLRRNQNVCV